MPCPLNGEVTSLRVRQGQAVKKGEVLLSYKINPEVVPALRFRIAPPNLMELEMRLVKLQSQITSARSAVNETEALAMKNMASASSLKQQKSQLGALEKEFAALQEVVRLNRQYAKDDYELLEHQIGSDLKGAKLPEEVLIKAPIDGIVIYIQPNLRTGAEIVQGVELFQVGVMDPMLIRAQLFEIEASKVQPGDKASFTLGSIPDKTFTADLTRLSWTPVTPGLNAPSYYEVELTAPNLDLTLKEGFKTQVTIKK